MPTSRHRTAYRNASVANATATPRRFRIFVRVERDIALRRGRSSCHVDGIAAGSSLAFRDLGWSVRRLCRE
jgi:hypothetical protein